METKQLDHLFNPTSLAVVGASNDERKIFTRFLKGIIEKGYRGNIYPVNPNESEILGLRSYRSVLDIPEQLDLVYIIVPVKSVFQVISECSQKNVRFAVVHSAGFSELGEDGKRLEEELVRIAQMGGTRIIGPNCMGIYAPEAHINTIATETISQDEVGHVAFVGQSGWVPENVIQMGYERGLRFSKVISIGNQSDLTLEDMLEYLAGDKNTKVIAFYIEGVKRGKEFIRLAKSITKDKPIVVWKAGRSNIGGKAVASHTGSLSGNSIIFEAALRQAGVAIARNLDELTDIIVGFSCPVLPEGNKVGLLVESGGGAVAAADAAEELRLEVPAFSAEIQDELMNILKGILPPFAAPRNPVDLVWPPATNRVNLLMQCLRVMLKEVDAILLVNFEVYDDYLAKEINGLVDEIKKPILLTPGQSVVRRSGMSHLTRNRIPTFNIPERAVTALYEMVRYSNYLRNIDRSENRG